VTPDQRRWFIVLVAAIVGGQVGSCYGGSDDWQSDDAEAEAASST
jgi:hypothetical protein